MTHHTSATADTAPQTPASVEAVYQSRSSDFGARGAAYTQQSTRMANINMALFVGTLICLGIGVWQSMPLLFVAAAALAIGFVVAYLYHGRIDRQERRYTTLKTINQEGLQRLERAWAKLPLRQPGATPADAVARDLDLLGHASLQHLLNTAHTPVGQSTLQGWLLTPAAPAAVRARQAAVAELAAQIDFRDELGYFGRGMEGTQTDYEQLLRWAESPRWFAQRPWLVPVAQLSALLTIALIAAHATGLTALPLWAIPVLFNGLLSLLFGRQINEIIDQVVARQRVFRAYGELFQLISAQQFKAPLLQQLHNELTAGSLSAAQQMHRLGRIMPLADLRMMQFFPLIQLLTLWTFHVLWLLERWQVSAGSHVRTWLTALGNIEALAALATLKHDHPHWTFPELLEHATPGLEVAGLAHPLLSPRHAVSNDVAIGPPGTFLLVTGSNMSGKSTLLRSIGMNVVLAQAGGPVSAVSMRLTPMRLATSMRVQDSLEQGISYFMAEIQRLKAIVDQAQAIQETGGPTLLYLLDEILHGTNTAERLIAARQIIRHLMDLGAIGAVSTHDLTLADSPQLVDARRAVYFTELFTRGPDGPVMRFDYTLRPGIATSTNAIKLMELIGLPLDAGELVEH